MSDSITKEKNEREFDLLLKKKLTGKEQQQHEFLRNVPLDLKLKFGSIDIMLPQFVPDYPHGEIEYRVKDLEEKVTWLLEEKIHEYSDGHLDDIKKEFSSIPFVQKIYVEKIPSGYDLVIIHNEEKTNIALSAITHSKINLKKKLTNVYIELTVLRSSDFNRKEWASRKLIFERN